MTSNRSVFNFTLARLLRDDKTKDEATHCLELMEEWKNTESIKAYTLLYLDDQIEKLNKRLDKLTAIREELENSEGSMSS